MPRISGRSGKVLVLPIRPSPRARKVPTVFGFAPILERICVTVIVFSEMTSEPLLMRDARYKRATFPLEQNLLQGVRDVQQ